MYSCWAFVDVDGTLIDKDDHPRPHIIELFQRIKKANAILVVWSGGGAEYAKSVVRMLSQKLNYNLTDMVNHFLWKGNPIQWNHIRPVWFVDDSKQIKSEHSSDGEKTCLVPFYHSSTMESDQWLRIAAKDLELFVNEYHAGGVKKLKKDSIV